MKAIKSLGQNFLVDNNQIRKIINLINDLEKSTILEVGPGRGALTFALAKKAKELFLVEIDETLCKFLKSNFSLNQNIKIIHKDFLEYDLQNFVNINKNKNLAFVSNLPYYISTKILFKIVEFEEFKNIFIMLQKELVNRIVAKPNTREYGRLSVAINSIFSLEDKLKISKNCFKPVPKIDSAFIHLKRKDFLIKEQDEYLFFIKCCFAFKRKKIINSLKNSNYPYDKVLEWLDINNLSINTRAEQLTINNYLNLWNFIN